MAIKARKLWLYSPRD